MTWGMLNLAHSECMARTAVEVLGPTMAMTPLEMSWFAVKVQQCYDLSTVNDLINAQLPINASYLKDSPL